MSGERDPCARQIRHGLAHLDSAARVVAAILGEDREGIDEPRRLSVPELERGLDKDGNPPFALRSPDHGPCGGRLLGDHLRRLDERRGSRRRDGAGASGADLLVG